MDSGVWENCPPALPSLEYSWRRSCLKSHVLHVALRPSVTCQDVGHPQVFPYKSGDGGHWGDRKRGWERAGEGREHGSPGTCFHGLTDASPGCRWLEITRLWRVWCMSKHGGHLGGGRLAYLTLFLAQLRRVPSDMGSLGFLVSQTGEQVFQGHSYLCY